MFIEIHDYLTGDPLLVNTDKIAQATADGDHTMIYFGRDWSLECLETYDALSDIIITEANS